MNEWLTQELAQDIGDQMMQDIPYSINIMNEKGIIIGSSRRRVGTLYNGAVKVLESGQIVEIYQNDRYQNTGNQ